jgi:hypothetical protein
MAALNAPLRATQHHLPGENAGVIHGTNSGREQAKASSLQGGQRQIHLANTLTLRFKSAHADFNERS